MLASLHRAARVTALVLLAWTALDLGYARCCLRDTVTGTSVVTVTDADRSAAADHADGDECFCCARCIDTGNRLQDVAPAATRREKDDTAVPLAARAATLDHPPQNA